MKEKRLIDANVCPCIKCDRLGNCRPGLCEAFAEWWLSPVDAVEVVRCKDCKHEQKCLMCIEVIGDTPLTTSSRHIDFCSYGERIENGNL